MSVTETAFGRFVQKENFNFGFILTIKNPKLKFLLRFFQKADGVWGETPRFYYFDTALLAFLSVSNFIKTSVNHIISHIETRPPI